MPSVLLKQVTPYNATTPTDCRIVDGKISAFGAIEATSTDRVIDASGLTLLPGAMDMHVHFRVPGGEQKEDWVTGTSAALAGGVTTVLDMPNTTPAITTKKLLEDKIAHITAQQHPIDFGCYIGATNDNLDELLLVQDLACGIKIAPYFTGKNGKALIDDVTALQKVFRANIRIPIVIHCEDEAIIAHNREAITDPQSTDHNAIRSQTSAMSALTRVLLAARGTRAKIHITHVSTKREITTIVAAKREGMDITCDVTPHHFTFTEEDVIARGGVFKVNPPLRSMQERDALWQAVVDGTVDMVGSDHAPHLLSEKSASSYDRIPPGVPGVQTLLPVLLDRLSHQFSLDDIVRLTSTAPRARFSRPAISLSVGDPADLVLVDLDKTTVIHPNMLKSKCGWSPWEGKTLQGKIVMTIVHGAIVSRG